MQSINCLQPKKIKKGVITEINQKEANKDGESSLSDYFCTFGQPQIKETKKIDRKKKNGKKPNASDHQNQQVIYYEYIRPYTAQSRQPPRNATPATLFNRFDFKQKR